MTQDLIPDSLPQSAALVRDFVNTLDHELGTDELATTTGLTGFLQRQGLLDAGLAAPEADERQRGEAVALRAGLHRALELNHDRGVAGLAALDEALGLLPVRLRWDGDAVVAAPAEVGVAGALARIGLAAHDARATEVWRRLKICSFDECEWAYYDHSKNRSRHYCEYGCGNKLKTRAYRARRRAAAPRESI